MNQETEPGQSFTSGSTESSKNNSFLEIEKFSERKDSPAEREKMGERALELNRKMREPLADEEVADLDDTIANRIRDNLDPTNPHRRNPDTERKSWIDRLITKSGVDSPAMENLIKDLRGIDPTKDGKSQREDITKPKSLDQVFEQLPKLSPLQREQRLTALLGLSWAMNHEAKTRTDQRLAELVALRTFSVAAQDKESKLWHENRDRFDQLFSHYAQNEDIPLRFQNEFKETRDKIQQQTVDSQANRVPEKQPRITWRNQEALQQQDRFSREDIAALNAEFNERLKSDPFSAAQLLARMKRAGFGFNPKVSPQAAARLDQAKAKLVEEIETYQQKSPDLLAAYLTYLKYTGIHEPTVAEKSLVRTALSARLQHPVPGQDNTQLAMQARYLKAQENYSAAELTVLQEGVKSGGIKGAQDALSKAKAAARLKYVGGRPKLSDKFHGAIKEAITSFKEADNLPLTARLAYVYQNFFGGRVPQLNQTWTQDKLADLKQKRSWNEYLETVSDIAKLRAAPDEEPKTEPDFLAAEAPVNSSEDEREPNVLPLPTATSSQEAATAAEDEEGEIISHQVLQTFESLNKLTPLEAAERIEVIYEEQRRLEANPAFVQAKKYVDKWGSSQKHEGDPLWQILTKYTPDYARWVMSGGGQEEVPTSEDSRARQKYLRVIEYDLDTVELEAGFSAVDKVTGWVAKAFTRTGFAGLSGHLWGRQAQENLRRARQEAIIGLRTASLQGDKYNETVRLAAMEMANRLELTNLREQIKKGKERGRAA